MREDYKAAKKLGDEAVREAHKKGISPYLPVLDLMEEVKDNVGQTRLGLMELPLDRIKGNKEAARNNAFANNFMPLFEDGTEFAVKWSNLYDSYLQEGIRDAIKVYEFMNCYYVQEGNKRVSVSKYGGTEFILADVTRIIPRKNSFKEVQVYYEYMDFYKVTKNFLIVFSEPGAYQKLADIMGQDLENEWPEDLCVDLKSSFFRFSRNLKKALGIEDEYHISDAFLVYISIFPFKTIEDSSDDQIINNIKMAHNEFLGNTVEDTAYLTDAPIGEEKTGSFMSLFSRTKKYTWQSPLKVAFVYDVGIEDSRWVDSHEAGRLYVDEMTDNNVVTHSYIAKDLGGIDYAIGKAIHEKNEIVFTVTPDMLQETLSAAVHTPSIKFLNCSLDSTYSSVRCYQGKFYEAAFLMGVYTANVLLLNQVTPGKRKIGYLIRGNDSLSIMNLNAFAIGVSLIDPECKVSIKTPKGSDDTSYKAEWKEEGISYYADLEYSTKQITTGRQGVFKMEEERDKYIGSAYFSWGKYYVQIVQSVLSGAWDITEAQGVKRAANYWFGISTGVVDVRIPGNVYQTKKMLSFMKNSVIKGELGPFFGEIHTRDGRTMQVQQYHNKRGVSVALESMDEKSLLHMDWLNENIEGEIPK